MSLFWATLISGIFLIIKGAAFTWKPAEFGQKARASLRDDRVTLLLLVVASAWFLLGKILQLGEADFGNYKALLFIFFGGVAVSSWFYCRDFLGVRYAAALFLLIASELLKAAFGHWDVESRLFLVSWVYVGISVSLYLGALPYRARDILDWFNQKSLRLRVAGILSLGYGFLLCGVAFSY